MTCCEQLEALQRVAELVGAMIVEVPKAKYEHAQAYISRRKLARIEQALVDAGYNMTEVRERYRKLKNI